MTQILQPKRKSEMSSPELEQVSSLGLLSLCQGVIT